MRAQRAQSGIALFVAVFALMLLSAVAMGLMYMADTETTINSNYRDSQQAYFAAKAGLEEVRERMMPANTAPHLISGPTAAPSTATPGSVIYVVNAAGSETISFNTAGTKYFDDELCQETAFTNLNLGSPTTNVPCGTSFSGTGWYTTINSDGPYSVNGASRYGTPPNPMSYKWVRITTKTNASSTPYIVDGSSTSSPNTPTKPVCWDGVHQLLLPSSVSYCNQPDPGTTVPPPRTQVYTLTSLAVTPSGARRMLQMEVAQDPPLYTNAAVDSQDHVVLNGQLTVNGYDYCSCVCTVTGSGSSATATCVDRLGRTCDRTRYAIYSSSSIDPPNASEVIVAGPNPPTAQNQPWPYDIPAEIQRYEFAPGTVNALGSPYNYNCNGSPPSCGTHAGQTFGVPPAFPPTPPDSPLSSPLLGPWYDQVTYVPGNLQITGNSIGAGVLVVDGDLDIHGGLQFYGLILVRGVISFTGGGSQTTNIYGAVLAGQESRVDTTLGGSAVINYDYCSLPQGNLNQPPRVLASREMMY